MASSISERKRVREVRKYYNRSPEDAPIAGAPLPAQNGLESTKGMATTAVASPNKTLTALMQLIACRLGMERAMVSVVDENAQYFLAESTKTLDLVDPLKHDEGDQLWMGCGGTIRSEALCANTIKLPPQERSYACFSVSDLPLDPRFDKLPYVAGPPFFRFYAGTPLLTRENVPIGSVFVIDTRARGPPTQFEIDLLGIMAKNVMEYLEMRRESEMRKRNQIMSQGLASLVEGRFSLLPQPQIVEPTVQSCSQNRTLKTPETALKGSTGFTIPEEPPQEPAVREISAPTECLVKEQTIQETLIMTTIKAVDLEIITTETVSATDPATQTPLLHECPILEDSKLEDQPINTVSNKSEANVEGQLADGIAATIGGPSENPLANTVSKVPAEIIPTPVANEAPETAGVILDEPLKNEAGLFQVRPDLLPTIRLEEELPNASRPSLIKSPAIGDCPQKDDSESVSKAKGNLNACHPGFGSSGQDGSRGSSYLQTKSRLKDTEEIPTHEKIIQGATNLLREALGVNYAMFLDLIEDFTASSASEESNVTSTGPNGELPLFPSRLDNQTLGTPDCDKDEPPAPLRRPSLPYTRSSHSSLRKQASAKVLSISKESFSPLSLEEISVEVGFKSPDCKLLRRLLKRYPDGKLWAFNDEGVESSDSEDDVDDLKRPSTAKRRSESNFLIQCFPGARQIIYAPLFNVEKGIHVAACFCVSLESAPIFTTELELTFLRAFMNNVSVSCNRSSMAAANRLKGDFISSISHELRSPLHGILASAELLSTSDLDRRQKEYCTTVSTCGQALLETITGILEYTKINTIKRDSRGSPQLNGKRSLPLKDVNAEESVSNNPVSELLASSTVDIGKVCEDSCLLVAAAYTHHTSTPGQPLYRVFVPPEAAHQLNGDISAAPAPVNIILDISPGNWKLVALPGALQRIVMNLVGNSLKYTTSGFIKVKLDILPIECSPGLNGAPATGSAVVELDVIDSGRGISNEFLKTKLFSAFSQETILAPGTGLGLHLVKSLVQMHEGSIDIQSEVGVGTHVMVKLRLKQAPGDVEAESGLQLTRNESDDSIAEVRRNKRDKSFQFYGFDEPIPGYIRDSLQLYLTEWFGMSAPQQGSEAAVVFTSEDKLTDCLSFTAAFQRRPKVIVVCDQNRQKSLAEAHTRSSTPVELLMIPFGPYKLSKALLACLEAEPEPKATSPPIHLNGFRIPNPDAITATSGGLISPLALFESPYSSGGDSFPWTAPATQIPVQMHNIRDLPAPIPGATLPIPLPTPTTPPEPFKWVPKAPPDEVAPAPVIVVEGNQPRVLCVDDNSINLRLLKTFMERLKFKNVTCAENGSLAFQAVRCQREPFDLIFMDLSMPVCDGFQAITLIRTLEKINLDITAPGVTPPKPALIVALTGLASQRDQDMAKEAGADHYITKPMKLSLLKKLLVEWGISV